MIVKNIVNKSKLSIIHKKPGVWEFSDSGVWLEINENSGNIYFSVEGLSSADHKEVNIDIRDSELNEENAYFYFELAAEYLDLIKNGRLYLAQSDSKFLFWNTKDKQLCVMNKHGKLQKLDFTQEGKLKFTEEIEIKNAVQVLPAN